MLILQIIILVILGIIAGTLILEIVKKKKTEKAKKCYSDILSYIRDLFEQSVYDDMYKYQELSKEQLEGISRSVSLDVFELSTVLPYSIEIINEVLVEMIEKQLIYKKESDFIFSVSSFECKKRVFKNSVEIRAYLAELFKKANGELNGITVALHTMKNHKETNRILKEWLDNYIIDLDDKGSEVNYWVFEKYREEAEAKKVETETGIAIDKAVLAMEEKNEVS